MVDQIKVFAPATIANLGPGYDVLGIALESPGDTVTLTKTQNKGVKITKITGSYVDLPYDELKNTAGLAALALLKKGKADFGVELELNKGLRICSGMGSSAASAAAAAFGVNRLLSTPLSDREVIQAAAEGERAASGDPHTDNVSASILGGLTITYPYQEIDKIMYDFVSLPPPQDIYFVIVIPEEISFNTEMARKVLPKQIPHEDAVFNLGAIGGFLSSIYQKDSKRMGQCMLDRLAQPFRVTYIPGFEEIRRKALAQGAYGVALSGSGPSVFAITKKDNEVANQIGKIMKSAFESYQIKSKVIISPPSTKGARIIK